MRDLLTVPLCALSADGDTAAVYVQCGVEGVPGALGLPLGCLPGHVGRADPLVQHRQLGGRGAVPLRWVSLS